MDSDHHGRSLNREHPPSLWTGPCLALDRPPPLLSPLVVGCTDKMAVANVTAEIGITRCGRSLVPKDAGETLEL